MFIVTYIPCHFHLMYLLSGMALFGGGRWRRTFFLLFECRIRHVLLLFHENQYVVAAIKEHTSLKSAATCWLITFVYVRCY